MFKVRNKETNEIHIVLDTYCEPPFHYTYFLIWEKDKWRWRPAHNFVPPNYKEERKE